MECETNRTELKIEKIDLKIMQLLHSEIDIKPDLFRESIEGEHIFMDDVSCKSQYNDFDLSQMKSEDKIKTESKENKKKKRKQDANDHSKETVIDVVVNNKVVTSNNIKLKKKKRKENALEETDAENSRNDLNIKVHKKKRKLSEQENDKEIIGLQQDKVRIKKNKHKEKIILQDTSDDLLHDVITVKKKKKKKAGQVNADMIIAENNIVEEGRSDVYINFSEENEQNKLVGGVKKKKRKLETFDYSNNNQENQENVDFKIKKNREILNKNQVIEADAESGEKKCDLVQSKENECVGIVKKRKKKKSMELGSESEITAKINEMLNKFKQSDETVIDIENDQENDYDGVKKKKKTKSRNLNKHDVENVEEADVFIFETNRGKCKQTDTVAIEVRNDRDHDYDVVKKKKKKKKKRKSMEVNENNADNFKQVDDVDIETKRNVNERTKKKKKHKSIELDSKYSDVNDDDVKFTAFKQKTRKSDENKRKFIELSNQRIETGKSIHEINKKKCCDNVETIKLKKKRKSGEAKHLIDNNIEHGSSAIIKKSSSENKCAQNLDVKLSAKKNIRTECDAKTTNLLPVDSFTLNNIDTMIKTDEIKKEVIDDEDFDYENVPKYDKNVMNNDDTSDTDMEASSDDDVSLNEDGASLSIHEKCLRMEADILDKLKKDIKNLHGLEILNPFTVPPLHLLEVDLTSFLGMEQVRLLDIDAKEQCFTTAENNILKKNWIDFCELHKLDQDPSVFRRMSYIIEGKRVHVFSDHANVLKFGRFLARGLDTRLLRVVYNRFRTMFLDVKLGSYTRKEDRFIRRYMLENKGVKIPDCMKYIGIYLNRSRAQNMKRYLYLQEQEALKPTMNSLDTEKRVYLVNKVMEACGTKNVWDLKNKFVPMSAFKEASKTLNTLSMNLRRSWYISIHMQLFVEFDWKPFDLRQKLIELIANDGYTDRKEIKFRNYLDIFDGYTPDYLYDIFDKFIKQNVPSELKKGNLAVLSQNRHLSCTVWIELQNINVKYTIANEISSICSDLVTDKNVI